METAISKLMQTKRKLGDYEENGALMCGQCHTPKTALLDYNPATGAKEPQLVPIACECQKRAEANDANAAEQEKFKAKMDRLRADGIHCPNALRHTFADDDRKAQKISDACRRYAERWEEMKADNIGILFYGSVGTGKTFFASAIGNALLDKRVTVAATSFPRLLNLLQDTKERQRLLDRLSSYKLLILDDLGCERDSTYAAEQIFNVIDTRANSRLPLIVTTNLTLEELENPGSMQYARIYDRVLELCPVRFKMTGASRRKGNAERRKAKARELLLE